MESQPVISAALILLGSSLMFRYRRLLNAIEKTNFSFGMIGLALGIVAWIIPNIDLTYKIGITVATIITLFVIVMFAEGRLARR